MNGKITLNYKKRDLTVYFIFEGVEAKGNEKCFFCKEDGRPVKMKNYFKKIINVEDSQKMVDLSVEEVKELAPHLRKLIVGDSLFKSACDYCHQLQVEKSKVFSC